MNKYVESVIAGVKEKYAYQKEFVQTVEEVLTSLDPVIDAHPEYEEADLLNRMITASGTQTEVGAASLTVLSDLIRAD